MSYQWRQTDFRAVKFRSHLYFVLLLLLLVLKMGPAMAIGRVECGDLLIPVNLENATKLSQTIFTAKIVKTTDSGIIKLRRGESLIYSKMDIIVDDIMKSSSRNWLKTNQKTSVVIVDENYAKLNKLDKRDLYAGSSVLFMIDGDRYTISGYEDYDKIIYREIENKAKVSLRDKKSIVSLPCEQVIYKPMADYMEDIKRSIGEYIRQQR